MRIILPEKARELSDAFRPYIDYTKPGFPFKPGTPESIKAKKDEWQRIVKPLFEEAKKMASFH